MKVGCKKVNKMRLKVKKLTLKVRTSGEVGTSSDGFSCVVISHVVTCFLEDATQMDMLVITFKHRE
jgi:hypothetical protein